MRCFFRDRRSWQGKTTASAAILDGRCGGKPDALSLSASHSEAQWTVSCMGSSSGQSASAIPVPASWRIMTAAPCDTVSCAERQVAGWDGSAVVVATLRHETDSLPWSVEPLFQIQPGRGRCVADAASCKAVRDDATYENVVALEFGSQGRTLSILLEQDLDVWDLSSASLLGRWHLGKPYTAMCQHGRHLLLARSSETGPVLDQVEVPSTVQTAEEVPYDSALARTV